MYHYTLLDRAKMILMDGQINMAPKPTTPLEKGEKRAVWLTTSHRWEETCFPANTHEEIDSIGRVRLKLNTEKLDIHQAVVVQESFPQWEALEESGLFLGMNPIDWHVTFEPIHSEHIDTIELYDVTEGAWILIWEK